MLDPDEERDRRREYCDADREPPGCRGRLVGLTGGEQPYADEDKDELGRRADRNIDHHAGGGLRARNAALVNQPRATTSPPTPATGNNVLTGSADPTHPEKAEAPRTVRRRKQLPPGGRVKI